MKTCTHLLFSVIILTMLVVSAWADTSSGSVAFRLSVIIPESINAPITTTNVNPAPSYLLSPSSLPNNQMVMAQQEKATRNHQDVIVNTLVVL